MKKFLAIVMSAVMVVSMAGCSGDDGKSANKASSDNGNKKTFTVGFDAEYPPYGYMDENGEYVGFDLELAQAVCDMEGWELVKKPIVWDSKDFELKAKNIDCIWNGFTMDGREDKYTWSDPYVDNSQVVVVPDNSDIKTLSDLKGKTVGVQAASAALSLLSDGGDQADLGATFGNLQEFADYNTAFLELQGGSVDAVAMDIGVANYQLESRGSGYKILDEKLNTEQYAIGFLKGNTELRDKVNADVKKLAQDGTVDKLAKKYGISDLICLDK